MHRSWFGRVALAVGLVLAVSATAQAQVSTTSATVRGTVTDASGAAVASAQVTVQNVSTGVSKGVLAGSDGRYVVPFLQPGGPYTVTVQSIGYGTAQREFDNLALGQVLTVDFQLVQEAVAVEGITVDVETAPLIDTRQAGVVDRVSTIQIEALPTNGRNFSDFIALAPGVQTSVGDGSGGNLSLGGGRRGATNITVDGVNNNGTFFGGEARGSDRIAFAFSIETVKEFQVITNGYDVEFGNFTGGQVNAITKSGTNDYEGAAFFYRRDESITGDDFNGQPPEDFSSNQFGVVLSGPIVRDKAHFLFSFDRQERANPVRTLLPGEPFDDIDQQAFDRFIDITESVYGFDASQDFGFFNQTNDQNALFARVDWSLNETNSLTFRYNFTDLINENDRVSTNEGQSNGGTFEDRAHSVVANLKSVLSPNVFNDFRFQFGSERRPREAATLLPQIEVFQVSSFGFQDIEIFNDPVLPNNLEEDVFQIVNNLTWQVGDHTLKFGTNNQFYDILNFFFFNGRGEFEFDGLDDYAQGIADEYSIATRGLDGQPPLADYSSSEHALYVQDDWAVSDRLTLNLGLRWDYTRFGDGPEFNQGFFDEFGIDNSELPDDKNNFAPRLGFAYDVSGDGSAVLRGGAGLFYGRIPSVFWSNAYLNDGVSQGFVQCSGSFFESDAARNAVISILRGERETFTSCDDIPGGGGFAFTPNINVVGGDVEMPGAWKFNLGYDTEILDDLRLGLEVTHSRISDNFYIGEQNLLPAQLTTQGGRPMFAPADEIRTSSGEPGFGDNRISNNFNDVLVLNDDAETRTWSTTVELDKRFNDSWSGGVSYAWSRTEDNTSFSCCIHSTAIFETPTAEGPNDLGDPGDELTGTWGPADYDRTHVVTANAVYRDAFDVSGLQLSAFYRGQSGLPYTPTVDGDVNADGRDSNDRAFLGDPSAILFESAEDQTAYGSLLNEVECLAEQRGRIATRNSCRNSWQHRFDARVSYRLQTVSGQDIEFIVDAFNVLNLLNSDWGVFEAAGETDVFNLEGWDAASQRHIYSVNDDFGVERPFGFSPQQWQIQLGVRYNIN